MKVASIIRALRIFSAGSLLILLPRLSFAQQPQVKKAGDTLLKQSDSAKSELLQKQSGELQLLQARRLQDSLKKVELQQEIDQLGNSDDHKKQALTAEIRQLKEEDSLHFKKLKERIDSLRQHVSGFPVSPFRDTIFYVYARLGSFSPRDRAEAISRRIRNLAGDFRFRPDSLKVSPSEFTLDVLYNNEVLTSISDNDAIWRNTDKQTLAEEYRKQIGLEVMNYKSETSWQTLLKEIAEALLVIGLVALIIYGIGRLSRLLKKKILGLKDSRIKGISIRKYVLMDTTQEIRVLFLANNILKWVVILLVIYLTLPLLFGIFPWTRGYAHVLIAYFLDPVKKIVRAIWNYVPNAITVIVIIVFFRYLIRLFQYLKQEIERGVLKIPGFYADWANPTFQIVRILVLAFMLIVIFPYLPGSDSQVFKGVSVFLGVLFTFGSAGALSNIVAGLVLTYMRSFKIGDRVQIGETTGDVIEKSLLVTRLRTIKNEVVSIPNSTVMSNHTTNYSSEAAAKGLIMHTTVTIGYDSPWRTVHELLLQAAAKTEGIEKEPAPFVLQTGLDDFYVSYQINAYTREPGRQAAIYSHLHQQIQDSFNEAGVEIMSPHYRNLRDGNTVTIPPDYLPKDYAPTGFKVDHKSPI